jgi:hypothetical protein
VTANSRKQRGSATENLLASYYKSRGWPYAEAVKAQGRDVTGMPGLAPEVKARRGFDPLAWLRQAASNSDGDLPYVVFRPNGMGEKSIDSWGVVLRNEDFTTLLRAAGYGDPMLPDLENFSGKIGGAE